MIRDTQVKKRPKDKPLDQEYSNRKSSAQCRGDPYNMFLVRMPGYSNENAKFEVV